MRTHAGVIAAAWSPINLPGLVEWWDCSLPYAYSDNSGATPMTAYGSEVRSIKGRFANLLAVRNTSNTWCLTGGGYDGPGRGIWVEAAGDTFVVFTSTLPSMLTRPWTVFAVSTTGYNSQFGSFQSRPFRADNPQVGIVPFLANPQYGQAYINAQHVSKQPSSSPLYVPAIRTRSVFGLRCDTLSSQFTVNGVNCTDVSSNVANLDDNVSFGGNFNVVEHVIVCSGLVSAEDEQRLIAALTPSQNWICQGNSQTAAFGATSTYRDGFGSRFGDIAGNAGLNLRVQRQGVVGRPMNGTDPGTGLQMDMAAAEVDAFINPLAPINVAFSHETTNNIAVGGRTGAEDLADNLEWAQDRRTAGFDFVVLSTCPDRDSNGSGSATNANIRTSSAGLLALCDATAYPYVYRAKSGESRFDYVLDIQGALGQPGGNNNFLVDNLHYSATGHQIIGELLNTLARAL